MLIGDNADRHSVTLAGLGHAKHLRPYPRRRCLLALLFRLLSPYNNDSAPSITISVPEIWLDSSEAKNSTRSATCSGLPGLCSSG